MPSGRGTASSTAYRTLPRRPSKRTAQWAGAIALAVILTSCVDQVPPLLELSPSSYLELTSARSTVVISNAGGGALDWQADSDNPLVTLSAMQGRILRGAQRTLNLVVDDALLDLGDVVEANLSFASNGGDASVLVSYTVGTGIGQCGTYVPPEIGSTGLMTPRIPSALDAAPTGAPRVSPGGTAAGGTAVGSAHAGGTAAGGTHAGGTQAGAVHKSAEPGVSARPVPGEILVAYHDDVSSLAVGTGPLRDELSRLAGMSLLRAGSPGAPDLFITADPDVVIERLLADPRVLYAHRNYYLEAQLVPNDPGYGNQWNMGLFGLPQAWDQYSGQVAPGGTVTIAIIDSGVYGGHPDLQNKLLPGWDFNDGDADTNPGAPNGHAEHGTHVAGIAAALGDDGYGVTGVAFGPAIKILPVKVFDAAGVNASIADLVVAIRWSAGLVVPGVATNPYPADVINMSLGVPGRFPALDAATADAWNAGSLLVAASGNHTGSMPDPGVLSPANGPCVIAVGSVDSDYDVSTFSNTGPQLEVAAPGGFSNTGCAKVYSTMPAPLLHGCMSGTSMASPFVAGVAALVIGQGQFSTPADVRDRLNLTALRATWMNDARSYGNGVVCADAALGAATVCGYTPAAAAAASAPAAAAWAAPAAVPAQAARSANAARDMTAPTEFTATTAPSSTQR
ncbi:MAG TPA: S8 family serine peptidase, partial [Trueperaceae bacterium]|nr:S8 family serine peptidase [Trueperaceae bacterium]